MGFWHGFMVRGGERAHEQNLLDIQQKVEKHKGFTEHMKKISEDPTYTPEAQQAAQQRWMEAQQTGPMKFKNYDISDILTVKSPRVTSVPDIDTRTGVTDVTKPLFFSPSDPTTSRPGKWSPFELSAMEAEDEANKIRRRYEETYKYQLGLKQAGLQGKRIGDYTMTEKDLEQEFGLKYPTGTYKVTMREGEQPTIMPISESFSGAGVGFDAAGNPTYAVRNRATGEVTGAGGEVAPQMRTTTNIVTYKNPATGQDQFFEYKVDANNQPIKDQAGRVVLNPIATPSGYLPRTTTTTQIKDIGNRLEPWVVPSTTTPGSFPATVEFDAAGNPMIGGAPAAFGGPSSTQPATQPSAPAAQPTAPFTPGAPVPALPPLQAPAPASPRVPAAATPVPPPPGAASTQQTRPIPHSSVEALDPYVKNAPNVDATNALANKNYIPAQVHYDSNTGILRRARPDDKDLGGMRRTPSGGVYKGERPLTPLQAETLNSKANVMGTTSALLTDLLDKESLALLPSLANRLRIKVAASDNPWEQFISSVLSKGDPFVSAKEKEALDKFAAVKRNLKEHIQVMRTPLGAAGFRSLEAFFSLQAQAGDMLARPEITKIVMQNSLRTILTIQGSYRYALYRNERNQGYAVNNDPDTETKTQYLLAYNMDQGAALAALRRDGYTLPTQ